MGTVSSEEAMKLLSPEAQKRVREEGRRIVAEHYKLNEIRRQLGITQVEVGEKMGIPQNNISVIEKRVDINLSTLKSYIEALGGELIISAKFDGQETPITRFLDNQTESVGA